MTKGPLIPVLSLGGGIVIAKLMELSWLWGLVPIGLAIAIYLFLLRACTDPVATFKLGKWHFAWVILLFMGIGITDEALFRPNSIEKSFGEVVPEYLECEVTDVLTKTYGDRIDVKIDGTNGARARIRTGVTELSPGDIIQIPSKRLKSVDSDTTEIGRKILPMMKASGILYTGRIVPQKIEVTGRSKSLHYVFIEIRENIETKIERSHLSKPAADFLKAILMGDKTGLDEQTRMTFAQGGMAHILALSGLHIGILAGFLILLMMPIKLIGRYKWGYGVALLILWLYVAVTGFAYSSVRACIMTTFAFIGIIAERKNFAGNALCSACLLILLVDPSALFDAGFQLSVVCVGALLAFASPLNPIGHRHHPILFYICGLIITTLVATGASWVLTSYYFSQIPLMFLPTNLLLLPFLPLYLSIGVIFTGLLCMGFEIRWIGQLLDSGYKLLVNATELISGGREYVIEYQLPLWGVLVWLFLLSVAAILLQRKNFT